MPSAGEGPNHGLFVKVLARIEREPDTWDQGFFKSTSCQTAYCFAGHAVTLSGETRDFLGRRAAELLGIEHRVEATGPWTNGNPLFHADNTLDDLYRISADILGIDEQVLRDKVQAEVQS